MRKILFMVALTSLVALSCGKSGSQPSDEVTGTQSSSTTQPSELADTGKYAKADVAAQADLLWHEFHENEVAAKARYCGGKVVDLTGFTKQIRKPGGIAYVDFDVGQPLGPDQDCRVQCRLKSGEDAKLTDLETPEVVLRGKCQGKSGRNVIFFDCEVGPFPDLVAIQVQVDAAIKDGGLAALRAARSASQARGVPADKMKAWAETISPVIAQREADVKQATDSLTASVRAAIAKEDFAGARQQLANARKSPLSSDLYGVIETLQPEIELKSKIAEAKKSAVFTLTRKNGSKLSCDFMEVTEEFKITSVEISYEAVSRIQDVLRLTVKFERHSGQQLPSYGLIADAGTASAPSLQGASGEVSVEIDGKKISGGKVTFRLR